MKIKYSPCKWNPNAKHAYGVLPDTTILVQDDNTVIIDGTPYEFGSDDVAWDDISMQSSGVIYDAHREDGELCLTVRRYYTRSRSWDDGEYHALAAGDAA